VDKAVRSATLNVSDLGAFELQLASSRKNLAGRISGGLRSNNQMIVRKGATIS
jgi:hypothetical protein